MTTLKHKRQPRWNRRVTPVVDTHMMLNNWVKEYIHACFEHRDVDVLPSHQRDLDMLLW